MDMIKAKRIITVHVDIASYKRGDQILYSEAKDDLKFWADNNCILVDQKICSIVKNDIIETDKPKESGIIIVSKEKEVVEEEKKAETIIPNKKYNSNAQRCKGIKNDGYPCRSTKIIENGYCRHHKDQASQNIDTSYGMS